MKVLDLQCNLAHRFEGWFDSMASFEAQLQRQQVQCPVCGSAEVSRMPSAPRLNLSGASNKPAHSPENEAQALQAQASRLLREVLNQTENVGERFAEEARRIHYQETPQRNIRGTATREDAQALADEGIEVFAVPLPDALKGTLQ